MAEWTLSFKNHNNHNCVVTIYGMDTARTLIPAEQPFTTQGSDDEDFFKPVRGESGYIRCITKSNNINISWGESIIDHKVVLTVNSQIRWIGYVKQDIFTQPYKPGYVEMELAVVGILDAMDGVFPYETTLAPITLGHILKDFLYDMSINLDISLIYFSSRTNPETVINKYIQFSELYPIEDGSQNVSWADIWEDICNCFGWSMQIEGSNLYFFSRDHDNGKMLYITTGDLDQPTGLHPGTLNIHNSNGIASLGQGHTISSHQGKKTVTVTGNPGELDTDIWELDTEDFECTVRGYEPNDTSRYHYDFGTSIGDVVTTYTRTGDSGPLWKRYLKSRNKSDSYYHGGGIEAIGIRAVKGLSSDGYTYGEWKWYTGLTIVPSTDTGFCAIKIKPKRVIRTFNSSLFLNIKGTIRVFDNFTNFSDDATVQSVTLTAQVKFGNKYIQQGDLAAETWTTSPSTIFLCANKEDSGKFVKFGPAFPEYVNNNPITGREIAASVQLPSGEVGSLEITLNAPATGNSKVGYLIEDLSIELYQDKLMYQKSFIKENNEEVRKIGNGFTEEYSVQSNLTIGQGAQWGPGVILESPLTDQEGVTEYPRSTTLDTSGLTPEVSLANRMESYYSSPYNTFKLKSKDPFNLQYSITIGGKTYYVIAQDIDWRSGDTTITLIEKK